MSRSSFKPFKRRIQTGLDENTNVEFVKLRRTASWDIERARKIDFQRCCARKPQVTLQSLGSADLVRGFSSQLADCNILFKSVLLGQEPESEGSESDDEKSGFSPRRFTNSAPERFSSPSYSNSDQKVIESPALKIQVSTPFSGSSHEFRPVGLPSPRVGNRIKKSSSFGGLSHLQNRSKIANIVSPLPLQSVNQMSDTTNARKSAKVEILNIHRVRDKVKCLQSVRNH
eukprot:jgi/Bigna1/88206/estExt_fgenesh1_pg.C_290065